MNLRIIALSATLLSLPVSLLALGALSAEALSRIL